MQIRFAKNKHGVLFKFLAHDGIVIVLAKGVGEIARWDGHREVGMVGGTGITSRIANREEWDVAVKVTATMMRGE